MVQPENVHPDTLFHPASRSSQAWIIDSFQDPYPEKSTSSLI